MIARVALLALWGTVAGLPSMIVLAAGLACLTRYDRSGYSIEAWLASAIRTRYRQL